MRKQRIAAIASCIRKEALLRLGAYRFLVSAVHAGQTVNAESSIIDSNFRLQWCELASLPLLARDQLTWNEPMTKHNKLPPIEQLHELFELAPNGVLRWKSKTFPTARVNVGDEVGTEHSSGYKRVKIYGEFFFVHRIIWAMANNADPEDKQVDHINQNKKDNSPSNLRLATNRQNSENVTYRPKGKTGELCITVNLQPSLARPYRVQVRKKYIGSFRTLEEAVIARNAEFNRIRSEYSCW